MRVTAQETAVPAFAGAATEKGGLRSARTLDGLLVTQGKNFVKDGSLSRKR